MWFNIFLRIGRTIGHLKYFIFYIIPGILGVKGSNAWERMSFFKFYFALMH